MVGTEGGKQYLEVVDHKPHLKTKLDYFNKQGWGFADTKMMVDPANDQVTLTGHRYQFSSQHLPSFKKWAEEVVHINMAISS